VPLPSMLIKLDAEELSNQSFHQVEMLSELYAYSLLRSEGSGD
jgi:hypothetical protein